MENKVYAVGDGFYKYGKQQCREWVLCHKLLFALILAVMGCLEWQTWGGLAIS